MNETENSYCSYRKRTPLEHALALAARGIPTFPCLASKAPACQEGFKAATTDPDALASLWRRYPGELVGVPTGVLSGFDALDIDPRHGGDVWYAEATGRLPVTRMHRTRSGGLHLLFCHVADLRNTAGKIAPGVDTRAGGGFIIWWPAAGFPEIASGPLAAWPDWLLGNLRPPVEVRREFATRPSLPADRGRRGRYVEAALRHATEAVATAPGGTRNNVLNKQTFALCRFIATGDLMPGDVADAMAEAALAAGLATKEVIATIASALRAGSPA